MRASTRRPLSSFLLPSFAPFRRTAQRTRAPTQSASRCYGSRDATVDPPAGAALESPSRCQGRIKSGAFPESRVALRTVGVLAPGRRPRQIIVDGRASRTSTLAVCNQKNGIITGRSHSKTAARRCEPAYRRLPILTAVSRRPSTPFRFPEGIGPNSPGDQGSGPAAS